MVKLTKNNKGSKIQEIKFDLRNFGADKIYVIHNAKRSNVKQILYMPGITSQDLSMNL